MADMKHPPVNNTHQRAGAGPGHEYVDPTRHVSLDQSAIRGMMACRGLYMFSHESSLGNAPAHRLFERINVQLKDSVVAPRKFGDYVVTIDAHALPPGVTLARLDG